MFDWSIHEKLIVAGFEGIYTEFFYRNLTHVFEDGKDVDYLVGYLNYFLGRPDKDKYVHYLSNHDDPMRHRVAVHQKALMALLLLLPGKVMVYNGQLNGQEKRLSHHFVDLLKSGKGEWEGIPAWFHDLNLVVKTMKIVIKNISVEANGVLRAKVEIDKKPGSMWFNLGETDYEADLKGMIAEGLLSSSNQGGIIKRGAADIFYEIPKA